MKATIARVLRNDFLAFARKAIYESDGTLISDDRYIDLLTSELMKVASGKTRRLLINLPPRHLKTQLASVSLSAWILAHESDKKIMVVAYSESLARNISRSIRAILQADWFKEVFDVRIAKGHAEVMSFATTAGGALYAASIDGSVTGFGADVIIVDDPHNTNDAGEEKMLERTINRFNAAVMSRLNNRKRGRVVVIGHRIHDDDLSAHLINEGDWTHIALPLVATREHTYKTDYGTWIRSKSAVLRPDAFDERDVAQLRADCVNPSFDLYYQQDADGQALPSITAGHFPRYPHNLDEGGGAFHVISIDTGTDRGDRRSFSVIQAWASDGKNHYLVEQYRERCDIVDLERAAKHFCRRYRQCPVLVERTANGPALISRLSRKWLRRVHDITPRGSKASRLRPHIEAIIAGRVRLPLDAPFCSGFVQEFVEFPHGRHTDQVDAFTQYMDWVANQTELPKTAGSPPAIAAFGFNSSFNGYSMHQQPKPKDPGIMASSSYNNRASNAPFPTVKRGVKF